MKPERKKEEDVGAKKMNERLHWGIEMIQDICKERNMVMSEAIFIQALSAGISMFIQSEKR